MRITVLQSAEELGKAAAAKVAQVLRGTIREKGYARIVVSTGASQFTTIEALLAEDVDWRKVTLFNLDEYVDLPETHPASFRRYLQERLVNKVPLGRAVLVDGSKPPREHISELTALLRADDIDIGIIGIGENAHIAFNDPPADFESKDAYFVSNLTDECKMQQVHEKWFDTIDDVPAQAITMTCYQIMQCRCIVSPVPYLSKAQAIKKVLESDRVSVDIPATLMTYHKDFHLFLDKDSASLTDPSLMREQEFV